MENDTLTTDTFTSSDLAYMPDDGKRYEIIEGELYVSRQPGFEHQYTCNRLGHFLNSGTSNKVLESSCRRPEWFSLTMMMWRQT